MPFSVTFGLNIFNISTITTQKKTYVSIKGFERRLQVAYLVHLLNACDFSLNVYVVQNGCISTHNHSVANQYISNKTKITYK